MKVIKYTIPCLLGIFIGPHVSKWMISKLVSEHRIPGNQAVYCVSLGALFGDVAKILAFIASSFG